MSRLDIDIDQLDRYFSGELSPAETQRVRLWFASHGETADRVAALRNVWTPPVARELDVNAAWRKLESHQGNFGTEDSAVAQSSPIHPRTNAQIPRTRWTTGIVTAKWSSASRMFSLGLIAAFLCAGLLWTGGRYVTREQRGTVPAMAMTYKTQNAQQSTITLSDGTHVVLNVASVLEVPNDFGSGSRSVRLMGEAYFHVTHHGAKPFIVKTAQTETRVLGTEFGVRAYHPADVRVAVRNGRVAVNRTVLSGHEVAMVDSVGLLTVQQKDVETILGFSSGKLILREVSLRNALDDLGRWYNAEVRIGTPELADISLNTTLVTGNVEDLIEVLRLAFHARVVRQGRVVTMYAQ